MAHGRVDGALEDGLVWHYTDGAGLLSMVRTNILWATASGYLNDREEVNLGYRTLQDELDMRAADGDEFARTLIRRAREVDTDRSGPSPSSFFILSAAEHWDLLAMWRNYGGRGESYAIGIDPAAALRVLCDPDAPALDGTGGTHLVQQRSWSPVRYFAPEQRALATSVFDGMEPELAALRARTEREGVLTREAVLETLAETIDDIEQALALIKHEGFHEEREVRHCTILLRPEELGDWGGVVRYRPTAYGMAPFLWLTGDSASSEPVQGSALTDTVAPLPIRCVAISPSPNGPASERSLNAMLESHGYRVEVRRSPIPFRG
jgi:hypothetical protein